MLIFLPYILLLVIGLNTHRIPYGRWILDLGLGGLAWYLSQLGILSELHFVIILTSLVLLRLPALLQVDDRQFLALYVLAIPLLMVFSPYERPQLHLPADLQISFNSGKAMAGLLCLAIVDQLRLRTAVPVSSRWMMTAVAVGALVLLIVMQWHWQLSWMTYTPSTLLANFTVTCTAEEFWFRGVMLALLGSVFRLRPMLALALSAMIFGGFHYPMGGWSFVFMAGIAGVLYGAVFLLTRSLLAAVAAHCGVNLLPWLLSLI